MIISVLLKSSCFAYLRAMALLVANRRDMSDALSDIFNIYFEPFP